MQKTVIIIINDKKIIDCSGAHSSFRLSPVAACVKALDSPGRFPQPWPGALSTQKAQAVLLRRVGAQPASTSLTAGGTAEKQTAVCASDPKLFGLKYKGVTF